MAALQSREEETFDSVSVGHELDHAIPGV